MVKVCTVKNCPGGRYSDRRNRMKNGFRQTSLFSVPKDPETRQKWIDSLNQELQEKQYVCERHFAEVDLIKYNSFNINQEEVRLERDRWALKSNAVPVVQEHEHRQPLRQEKHEYLIRESKEDHYEPRPLEQVYLVERQEYLKEEMDCDPDDDSISLKEEFSSESLFDQILNNSQPLPQAWTYIYDELGITFVYFNRANFEEKVCMRITSELTMAVSYSQQKEIILDKRIESMDDFYKQLRSLENSILCCGTDMEDNRRAPECIGVVPDSEKYTRLRGRPRCKACRHLRNLLQVKENKLQEARIRSEERNRRKYSILRAKAHFEASQFESNRADGWKKLKPNAVPTLFEIPDPLYIPPPRKSRYKKRVQNISPTITAVTNSSTAVTRGSKPIQDVTSVVLGPDIDDIPDTADDEIDLSNSCRLCLVEDTPRLVNLLTISDYQFIVHKVMECTSIQILPDESVSSLLICTRCLNIISVIDSFQQMCYKSDVYLKTLNGKKIRRNVTRLKLEIIGGARKIIENSTEIRWKTDGETKENSVKEEEVENAISSVRNFDDNSTHFSDDSKCEDEADHNFADNQPIIEHIKRENSAQSPNDDGKLKTKQGKLCDVCGKFVNYLNSHVATTHSLPTYKCENCDKTFSNPRSLRNHDIVHTPVLNYMCEICGKNFSRARSLRRHKITVHLQIRKFQCPTCLKFFRFKWDLKIHSTIHTGEREYKCDFLDCPKQYNTNAELLTHKFSAHNDTTSVQLQICNVCGEKFTLNQYKRHLKMHEKHEEIKPLHCSMCTESFSARRLLLAHRAEAHSIQNVSGNQCPVCNKVFKKNAYLKEHITLHVGKKNKCEICGKRFQYQCYLTEHIRVHTGERPCQCTICNKAFISNRLLRKHNKLAHQIE